MAVLRKNHLIQKRNVLNEIRANNMSLQELRFFSIYLSKINKDRIDDTRVVRFPLEDFRAIMELGRIDINYMKNVTNGLLCKVVNIPDERGGFTGFQLFKECTVSNDDNGAWYVEIDAHDKALPLMFEFKNRYFSYKLWNALRLRSVNQFRMYEILKQYETTGARILSLDELRELLGIGKNEYPRFGDFKYRVLDPCQKALKEHTDIKFTYEPHGKKGKGGKIHSLKFTITENKDYVDQLTLDMYIEQNKLTIGSDEDAPKDDDVSLRYRERIDFLSEACNGEFSWEQIEELNNILKENKSVNFHDEKACYDYVYRRYVKMDLQDKQTKGTDSPVKSRFGLVKFFVRKNIEV
jgi:plasmid replication initiation protein